MTMSCSLTLLCHVGLVIMLTSAPTVESTIRKDVHQSNLKAAWNSSGNASVGGIHHPLTFSNVFFSTSNGSPSVLIWRDLLLAFSLGGVVGLWTVFMYFVPKVRKWVFLFLVLFVAPICIVEPSAFWLRLWTFGCIGFLWRTIVATAMIRLALHFSAGLHFMPLRCLYWLVFFWFLVSHPGARYEIHCVSDVCYSSDLSFMDWLIGTGVRATNSFGPPIMCDPGLLWWVPLKCVDHGPDYCAQTGTISVDTDPFRTYQPVPEDTDYASDSSASSSDTVYQFDLSRENASLAAYWAWFDTLPCDWEVRATQRRSHHNEGFIETWTICVTLDYPNARYRAWGRGPALVAMRSACRGCGYHDSYIAQSMLSGVFGRNVGFDFLEKTGLFVSHMLLAHKPHQRYLACVHYVSDLVSLGQSYRLDVGNIRAMTDWFSVSIEQKPDWSSSSSGSSWGEPDDRHFDIPARRVDEGDAIVEYRNQSGFLDLFSGALKSSIVVSILKTISLVWAALFVLPSLSGEALLSASEKVFNQSSVPERVVNVTSKAMEHLVTLARRTMAFVKTGNYEAFFISESETTKLQDEFKSINNTILELERSSSYGRTLGEVQLKLEDLKKKAVLNASLSTTLEARKLASDVERLLCDVKFRIRASGTRYQPFGVFLFGGAKIGKSCLVSMFNAHFAAMEPTGEKLDLSNVYTRTPGESYWSGYKTSTWSVVFDDLGQESTAMLGQAYNPTNELIQVINNIAFFPAMADVAEKGYVSVCPLQCVVTSNNPDLNLHYTAHCKDAFFRRIPMRVTPKVKPEFCVDGQSTIDAQKCVKPDGSPEMDCWTFDVDEYVTSPVVGRDGSFRSVHRDMPGALFWRYYSRKVSEHFAGQGRSSNFVDALKSMVYCKTCLTLKSFCGCHGDGLDATRVHLEDRYADLTAHLRRSVHLHSYSPQSGLEWRPVVLYSVYFSCLALVYIQSFVLFWLACLFSLLVFYPKLTLRMITWVDNVIEKSLERSYFTWAGYRIGVNTTIGATNVCNWTYHQAAALWARFVYAKVRMDDSGALVPDWTLRSILFRCYWLPFGLPQALALRREPFVPIPYRPFYRRVWVAGLIVATILLVSGSSLLCARFFSQGGSTAAPAERTNVWVTEERMALSTMLTRNSVTGTHVELKQDLLSCYGRASFPVNATSSECSYCIPLMGNNWLVPAHFAHGALKCGKAVRIYRPHGDRVQSWVWYPDASTMTCHPEEDYCIIRVSGAPVGNTVRFIATTSRGVTGLSAQAMVQYQGTEPAVVRAMIDRVNIRYVCDWAPKSTVRHVWRAAVPIETQPGFCGIPLVHDKAIIGMHIGGSGYSALFQTLDGEWLRANCVAESSAQSGKCALGPFLLGTPTTKCYHKLSDVHYKCPIRWDELGKKALPHMIFGSLDTRVQQFVSRVEPTLFYGYWSKHFTTTKIRPRVGVGEGDWAAPLWKIKKNFLEAASSDRDVIVPHHLENAVKSLRGRLKDLDWSQWRVLEHREVLYGIPGNSFAPGMKFGTSAGAPYCTQKCKAMDIVSDGEDAGRYELTQIQFDRIQFMLNQAKEGLTPGLLFRATLKDEPIKQQKIIDGKIRIFQASSLEATYLLRKFFLLAGGVLCSDVTKSEIAVGINCSSPAWDSLFEHVVPDGWKTFCGDYSNFDQNMSSAFLMSAWNLIIGLGDLSSEDKEICRALALDVSNPLTDFFGDLLRLSGTNPSGHSMTVIINGLVNSLYMRYAYSVIFGNCDGFNDKVRVVTYGDDNVVSVHPDICSQFNQKTVSSALATICVKYTDATKSLDVPEFAKREEFTFLKRSWSPYKLDDGRTILMCPLEYDSIGKMLLIGIPSKDDEVGRHTNILRSSLLEMFPYGREKFNQHLGRIYECCEWLETMEDPVLQAMARDIRATDFHTWDYYLQKRLDPKGNSWYDDSTPLTGVDFVIG